jgi:hypothetical protein
LKEWDLIQGSKGLGFRVIQKNYCTSGQALGAIVATRLEETIVTLDLHISLQQHPKNFTPTTYINTYL